MTRDDALKALQDALAERLMIEFNTLADGFMGSPNAKQNAKSTFEHGVDVHVEALAFATGVINAKFQE